MIPTISDYFFGPGVTLDFSGQISSDSDDSDSDATAPVTEAASELSNETRSSISDADLEFALDDEDDTSSRSTDSIDMAFALMRLRELQQKPIKPVETPIVTPIVTPLPFPREQDK
jgi:hypothetical protein